MPELGEGATGVVEPRQEVPGLGRIVVHHAGITATEGYLASVAARLARKVVDKAGQGRKGRWDANRTVLLVAVSTTRLARLLGQDGLAAWLDDVPVEWGDLLFAAVAVCFSDLHGPFLWGTAGTGPTSTQPTVCIWNQSSPRSISYPRLRTPNQDDIMSSLKTEEWGVARHRNTAGRQGQRMSKAPWSSPLLLLRAAARARWPGLPVFPRGLGVGAGGRTRGQSLAASSPPPWF